MSVFTLTMPRTTLTMDEGRVIRWLKRPGELVGAGEVIVEVETDKSVVEVQVPARGYLRRILVAEGDVAPVGAPIALLTESADEPLVAASAAMPPVSQPAVSAEMAPSTTAPVEREAVPEKDGVLRASPAVRREARRRGIDLRGVAGSGPAGRILLKDLERHLAEAAKPAPIEPRQATTSGVGTSAMRRAIAAAMERSWREIPQFSVTRHVDVAQSETFRRVVGPSFEASRGVRLSVVDLLIQAVAQTLRRFPNLNRRTAGDEVSAGVHVGLAVAVTDGLLVPVLRNADEKPLSAIAMERRELTERALAGRLRAEDLGGATITISNLGPFGVDQFRAIVTPGEVSILAVGRMQDMPRAVGGQVVVRPVITLTLSVDHRVTDGAEAARFLAEVAERLEASDTWILF